MFRKFTYATPDWTGLILRLTLGIVLFPHGAQKLLGWFGGYGFEGTMAFLTNGAHLPYVLALLVIIVEFFGSLCLILGFAGRFWAISMVILMLGIVFTSHINNGFFMNWGGQQAGEGFEYHLLFIGSALALAINGSGLASVDLAITRRAHHHDHRFDVSGN